MAKYNNSFRRQLRGRFKTIAVLLLMILVPVISSLKNAFGFETYQEFIEEIAIWVIRLVVLCVAIFIFKKVKNFFLPSSRRHGNYQSNRGPDRPVGFKGAKNLKNIIEYWYQSILDGKTSSISERDISDLKLSILFTNFEIGRLSPDEREGFKEIISRKHRSGSGAEPLLNSDQSVEILIAPFRFYRGNNKNYGAITPFWIPAKITSTGELSPPSREIFPWIPREYLEPLAGDTPFSIGELADLKKFTFARDYRHSWENYFKNSEKLFKYVTGDSFKDFSIEGLSKEQHATLIINSTGSSGVQYIESQYDQILNHGGEVGLLNSLADLNKKTKRESSRNLKGAERHLAQFQSTYPLSYSQRKAVHESLLLPKGEILAVTGPPGTGKTTIIQSIIASPWVDAAIRGRASPPIALCCSSSNQATTNILESLTIATKSKESDLQRWLPDQIGFGLFCSSKSKAEELTNTLFTLMNGDGTLNQYENIEYVEKASEYFLDKFSSHFVKTRDLKKASRHLARELWKESEIFKKELKTLNNASERAIIAGLESVDLGIRYRLLTLAIHYWESRWLSEVPKVIRARELAGDRGRSKYLSKEEWHIRSMLTPCLVSTFSMAPEFFGSSIEVGSKSSPLDLLIADEAGQVSPEIGAATFSFASKAIVIGDVAQLEPVWSVSSATDQGNLAKYKLLRPNDHERLRTLEKAGVLASSGNLMSRALSVCRVYEGNTPGIFLSEQRRSVPKIVEFANDLSYGGKLVAIREELSSRILPAFGYADIRGLSERSGRSRRNSIEAKEISAWLGSNKLALEQKYNKSLSQIVAVITPFTAQTRLLRSLLLEKFPGMIIGTVHSLQGAERDVIIFSPVYDSSQKLNYIFDQGENMLNVAVTRARDSFLVFGDSKIFSLGGGTPSNVLAKYLFDTPTNRLNAAKTENVADNQILGVTRLDSLSDHRNALLLALREARKEVVIVSPTLSAVAIEHDKIDYEISLAIQRGIRVLIYTDEGLNLDNGNLKAAADAGMKILVAAGAELYITDRIHNKSLVIDDGILYEGSFNWLSAVRIEGSKHQKMEVSFRHDGPEATEQIRSLKYELNERKIRRVTANN